MSDPRVGKPEEGTHLSSGSGSGENLPSRSKLLALTSFCHLVNDGTGFFVPVAAALLTTNRGFSPFEIIVIFVIYYISTTLLGPFVGRFSDRTGKPALLMALGMVLLGTGLVGLYLSLAVLLGVASMVSASVAAFILGFGASFYHPLGATLLQQNIPRENLGSALGINGAMGSLGRALYPFLYFAATLALLENYMVLVFAFLGILSGAIVIESLGNLSALSIRAAPGKAPEARKVLSRSMVLLTIISFLRFASTQGVIAWLPIYMVTTHFTTPAELGIVVTLLYVGGILGQPFFGRFFGQFDTRIVLGVTTAGSTLTALAFLWTGGVVALALLFLLGFFTFSAFPQLMTLTLEYSESGSTSLANSLVYGLGTGAGNAVGPLLVGVISGNHYGNLIYGFYVMITLGVFTAFAVGFMPKPRNTVKTSASVNRAA